MNALITQPPSWAEFGSAGDGEFSFSTQEEWSEHAQRLQQDAALRQKMSKAAREFAVHGLCTTKKYRAAWREVFED